MSGVTTWLWSRRRRGIVATVVVASASGLVAGLVTPRGPVTATQALASMGLAAVIGVLAGVAMGSRWSALVAALAFTATFELARMRVEGPSVDAVHLDHVYGIVAFVLGRLVNAVLVLGPMALGAVFGTWFSGRLGRTPPPRFGPAGWALFGLAALGMTVIATALARPASTAPIVGPNGEPLAGSIAELTAVRIGGHSQTLMIRGRNAEAPVLLYLAGGPGGTDLGAMRADVALEQGFVVVVWEQRGAGKSYAAIDPVDTLTVEQMVSDTVEVTNYLRDRFDEDKVYLVGNSWGTILGVLAVQKHPELYHAFVGTGQMVCPHDTDVMFYEDTLAWAAAAGDEVTLTRLQQSGPPPYESLLDYEAALSHEHDWNRYPEFDGSREMPGNLLVPENTLMDQLNAMRAFLDTFSVLYPQIQALDFRRDATRLSVPVYVAIGAHEARGRAIPAREWFDLLDAPIKEMVTFEHSGHRPPFEEPAAFASLMERVMDATYGG